MVRLDTLPPEILHCIISRVKYQCRHVLVVPSTPRSEIDEIERLREQSTTALSRLCLVSKRLQRFAESHLYEAWEGGRSCLRGASGWDDSQQQSLQRFLLTIILRPDLAEHVKYIEAICWRIREPPDDDNLFVGPEWELFKETAEGVGLTGYDSWSSTLKAGSADPLIALLLTQVPNLQELSLGTPFGSQWPRRVLGLFTSQPSNRHHYNFANLRKVSYQGDKDLFDFNQVVPCFFLPSIEAIILDRCKDKWTWDNLDHNRKRIYYPMPKHGSKVTTLNFERSLFKPSIIRGIVRSCPALRSFTFSLHQAQRLDLEESLAVLDPPMLLDAINSARKSLVHLKLGISSFEFYHWLLGTQRQPTIPPIGSFRTFTNLSTLEISLIILLGNLEARTPVLADILPRALQSLKLRNDHLTYWHWNPQNLYPLLMALAVDSAARLPQLKVVDLCRIKTEPIQQMILDVGWEIQQDDLASAFDKAGIKLIV